MKISFKIVSKTEAEQLVSQTKLYHFIDKTGTFAALNLTEDEYLYVNMDKDTCIILDTELLNMFYWHISMSDYAYYRLCEHLDEENLREYWQEYDIVDEQLKKFRSSITDSIYVDLSRLQNSYDNGCNIDTTLSNGYGETMFFDYDTGGDVYLGDTFRYDGGDEIVEQVANLFAEIEKLLCNNNKY